MTTVAPTTERAFRTTAMHVLGHVRDAAGAGLPGFAVEVTISYLTELKVYDPQWKPPTRTIQCPHHEALSRPVLTGADGSFTRSFQWPPEHEDDVQLLDPFPTVTVTVRDPTLAEVVFTATSSIPHDVDYLFDFVFDPVTVERWELRGVAGIQILRDALPSFPVGGVGIVTAFLRNQAPYPVGRVGLEVIVEAKAGGISPDLPGAWRRGLRFGQASLSAPLQGRGAEQLGRVRFSPNPLDSEQVAVAFRVPDAATAHFEPARIPTIDIPVTLTGPVSITATLTVFNVPVARHQWDATIIPGA